MSFESRYSSLIHVLATAWIMALPGLTILAYLQTTDLSHKWKDKIPLVVELNKEYRQDSFALLQEFLKNNEISSKAISEFHSKTEAIETMKSDPLLGLNDSLIENPFRDMFLLFLDPQSHNSNSVNDLKSELQKFTIIENIEVGEKLKSGLSQTINKLRVILASITVLMALFAFFIINYLVRLNFERKLDLVKNIWLLGGSMDKAYKPVSRQGLRLGLSSSLLSIVFLGLALLCVFLMVPDLYFLLDVKNFIIVCLILAILGPTLHLLRLKSLVQSIFKL
ncbi:MAG: hypothetical protein HOP11_11335 [Saprospiraceae bacterium]|nr:hypothetical protein [Saprospiraceae bacterium]